MNHYRWSADAAVQSKQTKVLTQNIAFQICFPLTALVSQVNGRPTPAWQGVHHWAEALCVPGVGEGIKVSSIEGKGVQALISNVSAYNYI